jgi:hypothetical protein
MLGRSTESKCFVRRSSPRALVSIESYEYVLTYPPNKQPFYGVHLDSHSGWLDHHAIGVDGPLLHWDADDPSLLHLSPGL